MINFSYDFCFVGNELKYRLCKTQAICPILVRFVDCITPLCEVPALSSNGGWKDVPIIHTLVAQNFNNHGIEIWKYHKRPHCELQPEECRHVQVENIYKEFTIGAGK